MWDVKLIFTIIEQNQKNNKVWLPLVIGKNVYIGIYFKLRVMILNNHMSCY